MPTTVLFDIPNQLLYGGLTEDDLIAYTFQNYFETGDHSWPLLFPMAKSVIRTMDAIQAVMAKSANPIRRIIVSGASKQGSINVTGNLEKHCLLSLKLPVKN